MFMWAAGALEKSLLEDILYKEVRMRRRRKEHARIPEGTYLDDSLQEMFWILLTSECRNFSVSNILGLQIA